MTYESQAAREAQESGYGDERYWSYLDDAERTTRDFWLRRGDTARAEETMNRSLAEALQGNEGD